MRALVRIGERALPHVRRARGEKNEVGGSVALAKVEEWIGAGAKGE